MKNICLIALMAMTAGTRLNAQTNTNAALEFSHEPTRIDSESANLDLTGHKVVYRGHVRVDDPQMKLACQWLTVDLPEPGGRVDHIVAETNVVMNFVDARGNPARATGSRAVYSYQVHNGMTNETITLTGNPEIDTADAQSKGDVIVWDRISNQLRFINPKIISRQNLDGTLGGTNRPPAKTNPPAGTIGNAGGTIPNQP
ncbi:MAG: LptA/OstA family protein [Verrucomicrobiota bacterium]